MFAWNLDIFALYYEALAFSDMALMGRRVAASLLPGCSRRVDSSLSLCGHPGGVALLLLGGGGSPDFPLDLLWHHFREEWKDASLLSGADQSPESPCGLYSCRKGGGRTHYCLVGRWVSALCLSFFDTILTGLLGCLITTSQEWMSRLPTWPSLAWMGMGPQIF